MANYIKSTDFAAKDALLTGNPAKIIKGTEVNDEFNNIQTAVATKADITSPNLLGNPTAPTQAVGNNTTRIATTAFVQGEISANEASVAITGGTIDNVTMTDSTITGGSISGLVTDITVEDGGTGASSFTLNSVVLGNNVGALNGNMVAPGTSGNVLKSNGTTWTSAAADGLSTATSVSFGTTYTAATDGFIVGNANNNFSVNSGFTITVAGNVIVNTRTASEGASGFVTGMSPVKKGQSWVAALNGGASAISLWFIPFGN